MQIGKILLNDHLLRKRSIESERNLENALTGEGIQVRGCPKLDLGQLLIQNYFCIKAKLELSSVLTFLKNSHPMQEACLSVNVP